MTIQIIAEPFFAIIKNDSNTYKGYLTSTPTNNTHKNTPTQGAPIPPEIMRPAN